MSQLKLSQTLVESIKQQLIDVDIRAQNSGISAQYLAAIMGILLADVDTNPQDRQALLNDLSQFSQGVMEDTVSIKLANEVQEPGDEVQEVAVPTWNPKQTIGD
ncbi:MAG: hypothetical protein Q9O24_01365 [Gammaproteobacteria bacterium]|nr:hypothetical protein [Gammaproteobacteria bacterium]